MKKQHNKGLVQRRVKELIECHSGVRSAARVIGINAGYLSRLGSGKKTQPSDAVLEKIGIKKTTFYERID